ncbi:MAG: alpha/beta hydrolase [Candidatus Nanopelagicales bacterium]
MLDKEVGTRPLFGHLAARGHVVVDMAYRLFPETDVPWMVADALRAVAWVRGQAAELGIDPDRDCARGRLRGGHLALLAAYARDDPVLIPAELRGSDLRVCAVVSLPGVADLSQDELLMGVFDASAGLGGSAGGSPAHADLAAVDRAVRIGGLGSISQWPSRRSSPISGSAVVIIRVIVAVSNSTQEAGLPVPRCARLAVSSSCDRQPGSSTAMWSGRSTSTSRSLRVVPSRRAADPKSGSPD